MHTILKGILFIFLGLLCLFIATMAFFFIVMHYNNSEKNNRIETLKPSSSASHRALVVYQPSMMSGFTKNIAYQISNGLKDEGYEVTIAHPGRHLATDLSTYDVVVFGSPVYMGQTSSVLNDYIKNIKNLKNQKIILFVTGSTDDSAQLDSLEKLIPDSITPIKIAFKSSDTKNNNTKAYNLGHEIGKEQK